MSSELVAIAESSDAKDILISPIVCPPVIVTGTLALELATSATVASEKSVAEKVYPQDKIPVLNELTVAELSVAAPHLFDGTILQ